MYTKLDDRRHANKVNKMLQDNPHATQKDMYDKLILNWHRLKYLEQQGYFKLKRRFANDAKTERPICTQRKLGQD
jgi:hypothetical protein